MTYPRYLARAQAIIATTFTVSATMLRETQVADTSGGFVDSWAPWTTYPCSYAAYPVRSKERENTIQVKAISYWQFAFAADADVRNTDRIRIGTRTFEVVDAGVGSISIYQQVLCLEIL